MTDSTPTVCTLHHNGFTAPHPATLCNDTTSVPVEQTLHIRKSEYHIFPIDSIKIGDRYRKDLGDLRDLCISIRTKGLIEPIVVDRTMTLIAGERRIQACKEIGLSEIAVHFIDECTELQRRELELEENLQRKEMSWHEVDRLRAELHRLRQARYGAAPPTGGRVSLADPTRPWSVGDTADQLGITPMTVFRSLAMDHALNVVPGLAQADSRREAQRKIQVLIEDLERELVLRQRARQQQELNTRDRLILGDVCEELSKLDPGSVDCCIADPPYGVDMGDNKGWRAAPSFDDDPASALGLLRATLRELRRVLRPNGHLYLFFPTLYYSHIMSFLTANAFVPDDIPLVWVKDEHGTVGWDKRYAPSYEMFFFCSDGTRTLAKKRINVFIFPTDKTKEHPYQKPVQLIRELLEQSTHPEEVVLDLFGGSGSASIAAKQLGRHYIYIDNDQRSLDIARVNLDRVQRGTHSGQPPVHVTIPKITGLI